MRHKHEATLLNQWIRQIRTRYLNTWGGPGEKDLLQRCWQHHQKRRETCSELRLYPNQDNKNAIESAEAKTIQLDTIMTPWIRLLQIGSEF